jgi:ELWxxDGT repeat protein
MSSSLRSGPFARLLATLLLAASASVASAQPFLVADVEPAREQPSLLAPSAFFGLGSTAVFFAGSAEFGEPEVWRSDGTAAGTSMLFDVCPELCLPPDPLAIVDGHLFLGVDLEGMSFVPMPPNFVDPDTWLVRTDGTTGGTVVLGGPFSELAFLGRVGEAVLFHVDRWAPGESALLVADLEGEVPVREFPVGSVYEAIESDGAIVFANSGGLWRTDGTRDGTLRIDDERCFALAAVNGGVVCWNTDGALLSSDGGELEPLVEVPFSKGRGRQVVADGGGRVYYRLDLEVGEELWVTDGRPSGTWRIAVGDDIDALAAEHGRAYFAATDALGTEPWTSDGTPAGTRRLADLCAGACSSDPFDFAPRPDGVFFAAAEAAGGSLSLWHVRTRTEPPRRIIAGAGGFDLSSHGGEVYVEARGPGGGRRLWRLDDGLAAHDLGPVDGTWFPFDTSLPAAGPWLLFPRDGVLWRTDGTAAGSAPVAAVEVAPGSDPHSLVEHRGRLCFVASRAPWCTGPEGAVKLPWDGRPVERLRTLGDTLLIAGYSYLAAYDDLAAPPVVLLPFMDHFAAEKDGILYLLSSSSPGTALWRTDGTPGGTREVLADLGGRAHRIVRAGDRLLLATGGSNGSLWSSDGTAEGTFVLEGRSGLAATPFAGVGWYTLDGRLWRTDGTPEGTVPFADLPQFGGLEPWLTPQSDRLLIWGWTGGEAHYWATDGHSPPVEVEVPQPWRGMLTGGRWYYYDDDERGDHRLWLSDGSWTPGQILDLQGARPVQGLSYHAVIDGLLLFAAADPARGSELWVTDGTSQGTRRLFDLAPGAGSSLPEHMTRVGDLLYFAADDGRTGRELWAVPWGQVVGGGSCQPSEYRLCLGGGRFAVTVRWRDHVNGGEGSGQAVPLPGSDATGTFWFFDPANTELIVKALDGTSMNGHHWIFYGALSTVEYWIDVVDTATGETRSYHNPPGEQCGRGDTTAFAGLAAAAAPLSVLAPGSAPAPAASCGTADALCLLGGSLAIEVDWHDPRSGDRGRGVPIPGSDNTGSFWFFDAANVELVVKALDGTAVNGHRWVFYGGLSDVEYEIRVTEVASGAVRTYRNAFREICGGADTTAF